MPSPFLATLGPIPVNQLDALPLQNTGSYLAGGTPVAGGAVTIVGGAINRYYSPAVLGVQGVAMNQADPEDATKAIIVTNFIDASGCNSFTLSAVCDVPVHMVAIAPPGGGISYNVYWQTLGLDATDAVILPTTGPRGITQSMVCSVLKFATFVEVGAPPYARQVDAAVCSWAVQGTLAGTGVGRLFLSAGNGLDPAGITLQLWAKG